MSNMSFLFRGNKRADWTAGTEAKTTGEGKTAAIHAAQESPQRRWDKEETATKRC